MVLDAIVKKDGTLVAKAPKSLNAKKVKIIVKQEKEKELSNWSAISALLKEADKLDIRRRKLSDILHDLQTFRETE